jgi:hypothetical protein
VQEWLSVWDKNSEKFGNHDQNENSFSRQIFYVIIYNISHFFTGYYSLPAYLPKWKTILNTRWPCTRKHVSKDKVILWINFMILLQTCKIKYYNPTSSQATCFAYCLLHVSFLLGLLFNPEDGGNMFWNVGQLSTDNTALNHSCMC